jgi:membrane dipeptidase
MGPGNKGLTSIGKEIVDEMCRIGIAIDVSHLSDRGIEQILDRATRPIFASHSNAKSIRNHPRALNDELIRRIAAQGGTIGVNFYQPQLCNGPVHIGDVIRHIDKIVEIGGIDCCAIGSDFDGMRQYPRELHSSRDFPALFEALSRAGYRDDEIYQIAYWNLHDYIVQFV